MSRRCGCSTFRRTIRVSRNECYTHPIGIGKVGWSTPEGVTHVVSHVRDPVWRPSAALRVDHRNDNGEDLPAVVPAGPDNPLGKYEFRLGWPSYLIHGTNKPYGVGLRSSHGCVRLYPEDIEKLFEMVPNGTQVRVVNQPFLFGWHADELYLQAYTVLEDDARDWSKAQKKLLSHACGCARAEGAAEHRHDHRLAVGRRRHAVRRAAFPVRSRARAAASKPCSRRRRKCRIGFPKARTGMAAMTPAPTARAPSSCCRSANASAPAAAKPAPRWLRCSMAQLSEWLQLMLAEIARKQAEEHRAAEEQQARAATNCARAAQPSRSS